MTYSNLQTNDDIRTAIAKYQQGEKEKEKARKKNVEEIARIVKLMVPRWVLQMEKTFVPPRGITNESMYLGFAGEAGSWRQFLGPDIKEMELDVTASGTNLVVTAGEIKIGAVSINYAGNEIEGSGVAYAASPAVYRWVYLKLNLANFTATAEISADLDTKPVDTPLESIYRISLSKWKRTPTTWDFVMQANPLAEIHGINVG